MRFSASLEGVHKSFHYLVLEQRLTTIILSMDKGVFFLFWHLGRPASALLTFSIFLLYSQFVTCKSYEILELLTWEDYLIVFVKALTIFKSRQFTESEFLFETSVGICVAFYSLWKCRMPRINFAWCHIIIS